MCTWGENHSSVRLNDSRDFPATIRGYTPANGQKERVHVNRGLRRAEPRLDKRDPERECYGPRGHCRQEMPQAKLIPAAFGLWSSGLGFCYAHVILLVATNAQSGRRRTLQHQPGPNYTRFYLGSEAETTAEASAQRLSGQVVLVMTQLSINRPANRNRRTEAAISVPPKYGPPQSQYQTIAPRTSTSTATPYRSSGLSPAHHS